MSFPVKDPGEPIEGGDPERPGLRHLNRNTAIPDGSGGQALNQYHPGSRGEPELPSIAGFKSGLETVVIEATDSDGRTVGQFDSPGTLVHRYTLEQLKALGIEENDLALFRYDDKEREWIPLSTHVDTSAQTSACRLWRRSSGAAAWAAGANRCER